MSSSATSVPSTIWLGLDVHKESVTIAVLRGDAQTADRVDRVPNDLPKLKRYLERLSGQGPLRAVYEASGAGYVLHRACTAWGVPCDVIAPSLIPTKPGVQRKHDTYDAIQLARLHRAGELTVAPAPLTEAQSYQRQIVPWPLTCFATAVSSNARYVAAGRIATRLGQRRGRSGLRNDGRYEERNFRN